MPDPIILFGTRSDGSTAPVQIDSSGRVRINGLGEKGDPGEPGPPGPPGEGGEAGGAGAAATVAVGTVTTGAAGSAASVTNIGTSSDAVLDFAIPRGDKGDKGDQGDPGEGGEAGGTGAAATVEVGSVTTGAAGSSASVTNTGTTGAAVLSFSIPRGDKGDKGDKGDTGAPGMPATLTADGSGNLTHTARWIQSTNGAASAPPHSITGTWFTGGTATTTKPQLLIEPTGAVSTSWNTAGTGLGVNAANGFAGSLLDLQVNGASRFNVAPGNSLAGQGTYAVVGPYSSTLGGDAAAQFNITSNSSSGFALFRFGMVGGATGATGEFGASGSSSGFLASSVFFNTKGSFPLVFAVNGTERLRVTTTGEIQVADSGNIATGTSTGTKIGTATTQKLAFYNTTPVVQPAAVANATDAASAITQLNAVLARLRTLGLIAT